MSYMENSLKVQAAMEFMITYGWALVIIAIAIGIFAYFLSIPQTLVPPRCYFPYGITCRGIIIGSNTLASNSINFVIVNSQQYNLVGPTYGTLNILGYGSATAGCSPANIIGGGVILCSTSLSKQIPISTAISGTIAFSSSICLLGSMQNCQSSRPITYTGNFSGYAGGTSNSLPVNIILDEAANTVGTGTPILFTAQVTILGMPAGSASVSFTTNSPSYATISPLYALTDHNGNTTSYFSSYETGSYNVIASFAGQSASNVISVT
ncbi:MAG: Ig-like domain-containing protein [Candidatus Micrarchaeaceae archaeon]